jgi:hypothetical protein
MTGDPRQQPLKVEIVDGRLVVSIGVGLLCYAVQGAGGCDFRVTNEDAFAADIARELERDEEDGTTLLHRAFDKAASEAVEGGSEAAGLTDPSEDEDA